MMVSSIVIGKARSPMRWTTIGHIGWRPLDQTGMCHRATDIVLRTSMGFVSSHITAAVVDEVSEPLEFREVGPEMLVVVELGQLGNLSGPEGTRTMFVENGQDQLRAVTELDFGPRLGRSGLNAETILP